MDKNYLFISISDFADLIAKIYANLNPETEIDFSFSSDKDVKIDGEATGWYGVTKVRIFDADFVAIGYWGGGALEIVEMDYWFGQEEILKKLDYLADFEISNFDNSYLISVDRDTLPEGWEELR